MSSFFEARHFENERVKRHFRALTKTKNPFKLSLGPTSMTKIQFKFFVAIFLIFFGFFGRSLYRCKQENIILIN